MHFYVILKFCEDCLKSGLVCFCFCFRVMVMDFVDNVQGFANVISLQDWRQNLIAAHRFSADEFYIDFHVQYVTDY